MRRFGIGVACGVAYTAGVSLLAAAGLSTGVFVPALVYAGLGWWAAGGSEDLKTAIHRAGVAGLGCALGAWLVAVAVAVPRLSGMPVGEVLGVLVAGLFGEVKFVALAALVGRRQVRPRGRGTAVAAHLQKE